jgi:hypothetical protein
MFFISKKESINPRRQLTASNYSYLQPVNGLFCIEDRWTFILFLIEEQLYVSSNMDDLIDSMARRHLAFRRLDVCRKNLRLFSMEYSIFRQLLIDNDVVTVKLNRWRFDFLVKFFCFRRMECWSSIISKWGFII